MLFDMTDRKRFDRVKMTLIPFLFVLNIICFFCIEAPAVFAADSLNSELRQFGVLDHLVNISRHGDLKDISFIESEFLGKLVLDREMSPSTYLDEGKIFTGDLFVLDKNIFGKASFSYTSFYDGHHQRLFGFNVSNKIYISNFDQFSCISVEEVRKKIGKESGQFMTSTSISYRYDFLKNKSRIYLWISKEKWENSCVDSFVVEQVD